MWKLWARALGEKPYTCNRKSDIVAVIRTLIFLSYLTTNAFIVAGVIRHWGDPKPVYNAIPGKVECTASNESPGIPGE